MDVEGRCMEVYSISCEMAEDGMDPQAPRELWPLGLQEVHSGQPGGHTHCEWTSFHH